MENIIYIGKSADVEIHNPGHINYGKGLANAEREFWKLVPESRVYRENGGCKGLYQFNTPEEKEIFEQLLTRQGIPHSYQPRAKIPEPIDPISSSNPNFDNQSSGCRFIKGYKSVEEAINSDTEELRGLNGSFEAIAQRMQAFIDFAKRLKLDYHSNPNLEKLNEEIEKKYGQFYYQDDEAIREHGEQWSRIFAQDPATHFDNKVSVLSIYHTRGFQICPFTHCDKTWSEDVRVFNRRKNRELLVNSGTAHLAKAHHLLEKGNEYGISAKEFYELFM
jgi:hypothetical protein